MTALSLTVVTLAFPDPQTQPISGEDFQQISESQSFGASTSSVRTLSTTNTTPGNDLSGLLYTPRIPATGGCTNAATYVPKNSTTVANLPMDGNFAFIAIAPWISSDCTQAFLTAASRDPVRAFIFFLTDNSTDPPPPTSSSSWALNSGVKWQSFKFPVYAIPSAFGFHLLQETALYSGNVTNVPNGHALADEFSPNSYIRLAGLLDITGESNLPSLWVFLLIVLAILMFIIGSTSCLMHCIQRRRRHTLRRRVANGEVDLERLGIRRLTVPKAILDTMPLYVYPTREAQEIEAAGSSKEIAAAGTFKSETPKPEARSVAVNTTNANLPQHPNSTLALSQTLCAICLDDFVSGESTVRELPCRHIFHPECVDTFLGENSSLCPLCKKSSLPNGYCPPIITNAMVRRERIVRRLRDRVPTIQTGGGNTWQNASTRFPALTHIMEMGRRVFSITPTQNVTVRNPVPISVPEMRSTANSGTGPTPTSVRRPLIPARTISSTPSAPFGSSSHRPNPPQGLSEAERSDMVRQRAIALLGPDRVANGTPDTDEDRHAPAWRKAVRRVWPGLV